MRKVGVAATMIGIVVAFVWLILTAEIDEARRQDDLDRLSRYEGYRTLILVVMSVVTLLLQLALPTKSSWHLLSG